MDSFAGNLKKISTVQFRLEFQLTSFTILESVMSQSEKNWEKAGSRMRTVHRLFHNKHETSKQAAGESSVPYEPIEVPRYFSFPLKGDEAEFKIVCRIPPKLW